MIARAAKRFKQPGNLMMQECPRRYPVGSQTELYATNDDDKLKFVRQGAPRNIAPCPSLTKN